MPRRHQKERLSSFAGNELWRLSCSDASRAVRRSSRFQLNNVSVVQAMEWHPLRSCRRERAGWGSTLVSRGAFKIIGIDYTQKGREVPLVNEIQERNAPKSPTNRSPCRWPRH